MKIDYKKTVIIAPIVILLLILIIFSKNYNTIYSKKPVMTNKNFKNFLVNQNFFNNSCLNESENIRYYNKLYNKTVQILFFLEKNDYINKNYQNELLILLKKGDIYSLKDKVNLMNLSSINSKSLSSKFFLQALINDILNNNAEAEKFYNLALENNKFEYDYYFFLSKFYKRNCKYGEAIDTLLKVSSILNNSVQKTNSNILYAELGNLYFALRDYYNALANYTNALISLDVKNEDVEKYNVLVKIGDIMSIRGNYIESTEYYKYALSLNNRKITKEENINLILKLSDSYYKYGNYYNGLKFAKNATKKSARAKNDILYAKSKYMECLNYEYLGESEKAEKSCNLAKDILKDKNDLASYIQMGDMLSFSSYLRNDDEAIKYYNKALNLVEKDILTKVYIMEKIAIIKSYNKDKKAFNDFKIIKNIYNENNLKDSCCLGIVKGFLEEKIGNYKEAEKTYLAAKNDVEYNFSSLSTLYGYISDYYLSLNNKQMAKIYAVKALNISKNIYRYDHHYIKYYSDRLEKIINLK